MSRCCAGPVRAALAGLVLLATGCLTTPLGEREWLEVRTPHYRIVSALDADATERLAIELERFRAATAFLWGRALAPPPVATTVLAFDDRGVGRPFAHESRRAYLLEGPHGDRIVLRTGGGWAGDADTRLRLEVARRLLGHAGPERVPPWLREGIAQLASMLDIRGPGARVGLVHEEHLARLRTSQWIPFERLLAADDLERWSSLERELFEAETWALCHYLRLGADRRDTADATLDMLRSRLARGASATDAARLALGDDLQRRVWPHVTAPQLPSQMLRIRTGPSATPRGLAADEALEELAGLARALGRSDLAQRLSKRAAGRPSDRR